MINQDINAGKTRGPQQKFSELLTHEELLTLDEKEIRLRKKQNGHLQ